MQKCRITVVKKMFNQELADKNIKAPCEVFEVNQEFMLESPEQPGGFCSKAWADIRKDVMAVFFGGNIPWMKKEGTIMTCCTSGIRPVAFLVERVE
jgi:uncharacterized repeat protein (TIGR04076 family)